MRQEGIRDPKRVYLTQELAPAKSIVFAATGVTDGALLKGVRFFGEGVRTPSLVMNLSERKVLFVDTVHLANRSRCGSELRVAEELCKDRARWRIRYSDPTLIIRLRSPVYLNTVAEFENQSARNCSYIAYSFTPLKPFPWILQPLSLWPSVSSALQRCCEVPAQKSLALAG